MIYACSAFLSVVLSILRQIISINYSVIALDLKITNIFIKEYKVI